MPQERKVVSEPIAVVRIDRELAADGIKLDCHSDVSREPER
jgi:hypothetical protein